MLTQNLPTAPTVEELHAVAAYLAEHLGGHRDKAYAPVRECRVNGTEIANEADLKTFHTLDTATWYANRVKNLLTA